MRRVAWSIARFRRSRSGTSAVEFAIVLPMLVLVLLGGAQLTLYIDATRKVQLVATSVSEMISQAAPTSSGATSAAVDAANLNFSYDAATVIFPYVLADAKRKTIAWRQNLIVNIASVLFTKTGATCASNTDLSGCYTARVDWTTSGTASAIYRKCGGVQGVSDDTAAPTPTTLPRSLFGPGSIIAVDVSFEFQPTFGSSILPPISIMRSAFVQPRYVDKITFDTTNNDGIASQCPVSS